MYLKSHDVMAIPHEANERASTIEDTLLVMVHAFDADLLVMGGYTHSHLREMVFGGVTRYMLEKADVAVLMAH